MEKIVAAGVQDFEKIIKNDYFYIDKSLFIKEWWERGDDVTLITRPRRFGKTLAISMVERFFSLKYSGKPDVFESLNIWEEQKYRGIQGTYPVISLSFADIKGKDFITVKKMINGIQTDVYQRFVFLKDKGCLSETEIKLFDSVSPDMDDATAMFSLKRLSEYVGRFYDKKVIILLDEYDTPMQEAYDGGYWDEIMSMTRGLFNSTFKSNPFLERAIMTGITRISRESLFSDLNNLNVVSTTSDEYADKFGFTENEVIHILNAYGLGDRMDDVRSWYDGFTFGKCSGIYNPWSIINYLKNHELKTYWANTSSNELAGSLVRRGDREVKMVMEDLLNDVPLVADIDEQIVFNRLDNNRSAIWSLLLASGYLKVESYRSYKSGFSEYILSLTNLEVKLMFRKMISGWFNSGSAKESYNDFIKAMLQNDVDYMNEFMNKISVEMFSSFDTFNQPSEKAEPERFYHGFVLGLMVDLSERYSITSNRESGFGRYDIILDPKTEDDDAYIIEFKVFNRNRDKSLEQTVQSALRQIEEKKYDSILLAKGIPAEKIRKYGFAFEGKKVLIG